MESPQQREEAGIDTTLDIIGFKYLTFPYRDFRKYGG